MLYDVSLKETVEYYPLSVVADSKEEAIKEAWKLLENTKDGRFIYYHDSKEEKCDASETL
jgi:hypothetical protein